MVKETINQNEDFRSLELKIEPPDPIQGGWKISFTSEDVALCGAYNVAIKKVLDANKLMPFHQSGGNMKSENYPGYHMWEIWKETDEAALLLLLPAIGREAKEDFERNEKHGLNAYYRDELKNN